MNNGAILLEAHSLINAGRQDDYGSPTESFARIAALWSAYLGRTVTGKDVAVCMALLKFSREAYAHKRDNLLDAAGYIGLAADMEAGQ
jgi:predicted membrane-bound mannosyltransferase